VFLCPSINDTAYYRAVYERILRQFGDLPLVIFGKQVAPVADPRVLPFLSTEELFDLYASAPVFVYPSLEKRHVHYSPMEAMIVGTPTLYMRGTLLHQLAGRDLAGACWDYADMRDKACRLLEGDEQLRQDIVSDQGIITDFFEMAKAKEEWRALLA